MNKQSICLSPPVAAPPVAPVAAPPVAPVVAPVEPVEVRNAPQPHVETTPKALNYPAISNWLKICEDDIFERAAGDRHEYSKLAAVFDVNGCTRIDDITRMSPDLIKLLAKEAGVDVTLGLVYRVFQYAAEDVTRVRKSGRL